MRNRSCEQKVALNKSADIDTLNNLILTTDQNLLINEAKDFNDAERNFSTTIINYLEKCIPEKKHNKNRPKYKSWFDSELRGTLRLRNRRTEKGNKIKSILHKDKF